MWGFPKMVENPKMDGLFIMENPYETWDDLGGKPTI